MGAISSDCSSRGVVVLLLGIGLFCSNGCVSKKIEPAYPPTVSISQNSHGLVTISWPSQKGYTYRLVVFDGRKTVEDKKVYAGTGEQIVVQFTRDPSKPLPEYAVKPKRIVP